MSVVASIGESHDVSTRLSVVARACLDLQVQAAGDGEREWRLMAGPEPGALLRRVRPSGVVMLYEGTVGATALNSLMANVLDFVALVK